MPRYLLVRWTLALLAGAALTSQARAQNSGCGIPIKVDCKFQFNVKFGPSAINQNKAPWYTYFPVGAGMDTNQGTAPLGNRFPNWPAPSCTPTCSGMTQASFPNWPSSREKESNAGPSSQIVLTGGTSPPPSFAWQPTTYNNPTRYPQYPVAQMPGYWYGR